MPLKGATYAMKKTKKGLVRLAFVNGKVVEAKNMKTGAKHTPAEFKADAKKKVKRKGK
jgi:hypothetical protein